MTQHSGVPQIPDFNDRCSRDPAFDRLITPASLKPAERKVLEDLVQTLPKDYYFRLKTERDLIKPGSETMRSIIRNSLALSLAEEDVRKRAGALEGLLQARQVPEARSFLRDIAEHYPIETIRKRAQEILSAPPVPQDCGAIFSVIGDTVYLD